MTNYSTNVSDNQWQILSQYFDVTRKRKYEIREIVNAIFYISKTGCQWRLLPENFAPWKLVFYYFTTWKKNGIYEIMQQDLVENCREQADKNVEPTAAIIDAQSVKNTLVNCENKGFDAGKKIKGIKRHILVDTLGLILAVVIQRASVQDRDGAEDVVKNMQENWRKIIKIFADGGYRGQLIDRIKAKFNITLEIVKRNELKTFSILPKRWIVERTFAWVGHQ